MSLDDFFYKNLLDNLHDGVYFVDRDRKISYWNKGAERITGYGAQETVGKRCSDNLLMHSDRKGTILCLAGCPLVESMSIGTDRTAEVFLRHKDGHRVPVMVRVAPIRDEQGVVTGAVEIFTDNTPAAAAFDRLAELERLAYIDPLTGLANRRYAEISMGSRLEELQRYGWRFGILFIDIDKFKVVNDRYGHGTGDEVLKTVGKTLQNSVRGFDLVSRWGGEEYLALIANVEGGKLITTANRCRALVEQSSIPAEPSLEVTISVGATLARPDDSIISLVARADELMYRSKESGRNRVTTDQEGAETLG